MKDAKYKIVKFEKSPVIIIGSSVNFEYGLVRNHDDELQAVFTNKADADEALRDANGNNKQETK